MWKWMSVFLVLRFQPVNVMSIYNKRVREIKVKKHHVWWSGEGGEVIEIRIKELYDKIETVWHLLF